MIKIYFLLCIFYFSLTACAQESQRFANMTRQQIDLLLTETSKKQMTITERMNYYSQFFLGTPYSFTCVGDGENALYEPYPLVNFDSTNCMAFCEHVLALSISDSWDNFFNNLQQIRYKDGIIGMRTRNHYTMGDWLPENDWLLKDVSKQVGGGYIKTLTRTISHRKFFQGKGITDLRHVKPDYKMTIDFISKEDIPRIKGNLQNGDIGVLIYADKTDIFAAHMWMVFEKNGDPFIRESTTYGMTTHDMPYDDWAERVMQSKRFIGISLMRVKEELNQPGRIILPWEINQLKRNP